MKNILTSIVLFLAPAFCWAGPSKAYSSPLVFIENKGQITDQYFEVRNDIDLKVNWSGSNLFIGPGTLHYQFAIPDTNAEQEGAILTYRLDVELLGCNENAVLKLEEKQPYYEKHYTAGTGENGITACSYSRAVYKDIYPGIDWVLYTKDGQVKHEFHLSPGTDPSQIKIKYSGASDIGLNGNGGLTVITPLGKTEEEAPFCFTTDGSIVKSSFQLKDSVVSYQLGTYYGELTIDPTLTWGTYYTGSFNYPLTYSRDLAVHQGQYAYLYGHTSAVDIATTGAYQATLAGALDAFVVKFDSNGNRIWCTYFGGTNSEQASAITCDALGNIYMTGTTQSNSGIATTGCHQFVYGGNYDGFLAKFDSSGNRIWATYYGGADYDMTNETCLDASGHIYLTGVTGSTSGISSSGSYQTLNAGSNDAFLVKFDTSGNRIWGTYFGGSDNDWGTHIAATGSNDVYFAGYGFSVSGVATIGSHQDIYSGNGDGFLTRFDSAGSLVWSTYYGGDSIETITGVAVDNDENIYLAGASGTFLTGASLNNIATIGSFMPSPSGLEDAFLVKFNNYGQRQWGTYYGGTGIDHTVNHSLALDNWNNVYLCGSTSSSGISTTGVWQQTYGGGLEDGFITKFNTNGNQVWASYYGGMLHDGIIACVFDGIASVYLVGSSASDNGIATTGAFQTSNPNAYSNAFLSRINDCIIPLQPAGLNVDTVCANDTVIISVPIVNGALNYTWSLPGGWTGSSNTNTITVVTGTTGGNISVTAHSACGSSPVLTQFVPVFPAPFPTIIEIGNQLNTSVFVTYQWYLNGGPISGATGQFYTYTQQGTYTVFVTDSNGCEAISPQYTTGVESISANAALHIYPNPTNDILFIRSENIIGEVQIRSTVGQLMLSREVGHTTCELSIGHFVSGVYFLTLTDLEGNTLTEKIIKE